MKLSVIHIFSYGNGEAQIISDTLNFKANSSEFSKLKAVINDVKSKRPKEVAEKDFHAINIFGDSRVRYISSEEEGTFSCKYSDLNKTKLNALIVEFKKLKDAVPALPSAFKV